MSDEASERAARRRLGWQGGVVEPGTPKGGLYADLPLDERIASMTRLCALAALASGVAASPIGPRAEWPGEVFEIRRG